MSAARIFTVVSGGVVIAAIIAYVAITTIQLHQKPHSVSSLIRPIGGAELRAKLIDDQVVELSLTGNASTIKSLVQFESLGKRLRLDQIGEVTAPKDGIRNFLVYQEDGEQTTVQVGAASKLGVRSSPNVWIDGIWINGQAIRFPAQVGEVDRLVAAP